MYSGAKAAVAGFTRSLALELKDRHIRVNAVAPAMVRTMDNVAAMGDGGCTVRRDAGDHRRRDVPRKHRFHDDRAGPPDLSVPAGPL